METAKAAGPSSNDVEKCVFDFTVKGANGIPYDLEQHRGKPILCMNVASKCTFTKTGYEAATELYNKYKDRGFTVLAFPCNQFNSQEPGTDAEIKEFACTKFKADFPIMSKCDVNGAAAEPLWEFMKKEQPGILGTTSVKWNFTSFLCNASGKPVKRFSPGTKASEIEKDLLPIL